MRILFLDIDGVLNSDLWERNVKSKEQIYPLNQFDPKTITLLNKVLISAKAKIVLTSTWRLNHSLEEMNVYFEKVGITEQIIDFTPDLKNKGKYILRGNEILKWCQDNEHIIEQKYLNYNDFIILDDNSDMLYWQGRYFYQTDRLCGLTPTITQNIIRDFK